MYKIKPKVSEIPSPLRRGWKIIHIYENLNKSQDIQEGKEKKKKILSSPTRKKKRKKKKEKTVSSSQDAHLFLENLLKTFSLFFLPTWTDWTWLTRKPKEIQKKNHKANQIKKRKKRLPIAIVGTGKNMVSSMCRLPFPLSTLTSDANL